MPKWCVESYPSSLYKFEKTRFWHFVIISGRGQGGPNPCLVDTLYRIHSNEHSRYVTVRAHQHRHRPAPTPLANAQETIDFSLTLSGNSRLILKAAHS